MLKMIKYTTITNGDGSFTPTHHRDDIEHLMREPIEAQSKGRQGAKMTMKKRAKQIQRRSKETSVLPPIYQRHMELSTPYINHIGLEANNNDIDVPYINNLSVNRLVQVATPYILDSQFSKMEEVSPLLGGKESKLIFNKNHVFQLGREKTQDTIRRTAMSNNLLLDRRKHEKRQRQCRKTEDKNSDSDLNMKLHLQSNPVGWHERTGKTKSKDLHRSRTDEQFSIRKKIEQYRKWHDEQYRDKLKKLKQEVDNTYDMEQRKISRSVGLMKDATHSDKLEPKESRPDIFLSNTIEEVDEGHKEDLDQMASSDHTWKSWRDVNDSYAYTDVNKYIEENELMTPQKHTRIEQWIIEVEKELGLKVLVEV